MANIKIYNSRRMHFSARTNHFKDINVSNLLPSKVCQGFAVQFILALWSFDGKYQNLHKSYVRFYASSNYLRDCNVSNFLPSTFEK